MGWLIQLLASPILGALLDAYKARLAAGNATDVQAVSLAVKAIEAEIAARADARVVILAEQGHWYTALPRAIVQWSFSLFVAKAVVYDKVLGLGSTDALGGDVGQWAGMVMAMWFGGRTLEKIAGTIAGRFAK